MVVWFRNKGLNRVNKNPYRKIHLRVNLVLFFNLSFLSLGSSLIYFVEGLEFLSFLYIYYLYD